jgi:hypothetical protein
MTVEWMKDGPEGETVYSRLEAVDVGTDQDGETITSCVVVPVAASGASTAKKATSLPKAAQTALRALREALNQQGAIPLASSNIPAISVVSVDDWRKYAYLMGISASSEDRARQQAFKRASEHLIGSGQVGFWDNQVWLSE